MSKKKIYAKNIAIPVILGSIVGLIISKFIDYKNIDKPPFSPPSIVFPIVWTLLYILMGISYSILENNSLINKNIKKIYFLQLAVNLLWPIFFFVFKWRLFSLLWIVCLAILVMLMIYKFYKQNKLSGLLQIPYLLWSLFATYLNLGIYLING